MAQPQLLIITKDNVLHQINSKSAGNFFLITINIVIIIHYTFNSIVTKSHNSGIHAYKTTYVTFMWNII